MVHTYVRLTTTRTAHTHATHTHTHATHTHACTLHVIHHRHTQESHAYSLPIAHEQTRNACMYDTYACKHQPHHSYSFPTTFIVSHQLIVWCVTCWCMCCACVSYACACVVCLRVCCLLARVLYACACVLYACTCVFLARVFMLARACCLYVWWLRLFLRCSGLFMCGMRVRQSPQAPIYSFGPFSFAFIFYFLLRTLPSSFFAFPLLSFPSPLNVLFRHLPMMFTSWILFALNCDTVILRKGVADILISIW
jgi:hypothetical protein